MFETPLTIVGTIVTDPIRRRVGDSELIKFRVASNSRRRGADGTWAAGDSLFVTVNCWDRLVTGVGAAMSKGMPVIAVGTVHTNEYEDREGIRRASLEMRASAVGPDVSRSIVRIIEKVSHAAGDVETPQATADPGPSVGDTEVHDTEMHDDVDGTHDTHGGVDPLEVGKTRTVA